MPYLAVKVPVIEFELGWGSKVDDYMVCLSTSAANEFVREFNSYNTDKTAPDWYMQAETNYQPVDLTDSQYAYITGADEKFIGRRCIEQRCWWSELKNK